MFKSIQKIREKIITLYKGESISFYFASLCLILIPVYVWYIPPIMLLWGLSRLLEIKGNKGKFIIAFHEVKVLFFLFFLFYVWLIAGTFYSENQKTGWNLVFSRLSFFLFPLILIFPGKLLLNRVNFLLKLFCFSTTGYLIFCFLYAIFRSLSFNGVNLVFNPHPPSEPYYSYFYASYLSINQHPSYLAYYIVIAFIIALEYCFNAGSGIDEQIIWTFICIFLLSTLYFLSSRFGLLAAIIVAPVYLYKKLKKRISVYLLFALIIVLIIFSIGVLKSNIRVQKIMNEITAGSEKLNAASDNRLIIWKSALKISKSNLLLGVGIGDVRSELMKEYKQLGNQEIIKKNYNVHNQFLEILLENGLIGLMIFLVILGYMIIIAIRFNNILYFLFLITSIVFFLFETVLYRFPGMSFFALLSFLLIYIPERYQHK